MLRLLPIVLLLTGCSVLEGFDPAIDAVGKQIVADWKQRQDVAAAQYEYRHGLDQGNVLSVEVMLHADKITDAAVDELVEIAEHDCWRAGPRCSSLGYAVHTTADPPYADKPESGKAVRSGKVDFHQDLSELKAKYGPRPSAEATR